jgi:hypothetical protein
MELPDQKKLHTKRTKSRTGSRAHHPNLYFPGLGAIPMYAVVHFVNDRQTMRKSLYVRKQDNGQVGLTASNGDKQKTENMECCSFFELSFSLPNHTVSFPLTFAFSPFDKEQHMSGFWYLHDIDADAQQAVRNIAHLQAHSLAKTVADGTRSHTGGFVDVSEKAPR